eukprot:TRINITY_DN7879_c0_g1_i2.p1 TRINITY_DN7879_c0_g1~~TRINITY_DN7879_c0_g1_i2.p1  ORF type:complete len:135 (-),score=24.90 TRINITY_DN7879_c0_g1_i2:267-671(-)
MLMNQPGMVVPHHGMELEKRALLFLLVFFISWPLNVTAAMIRITRGCFYFPLLFIFSTLLHSQGMLNVIVYGFTNKGLREKYFHKFGLLVVMVLLSPIFLPISIGMWVYRRGDNSSRQRTPLLKSPISSSNDAV